ncbi:AAA family ATPase [Streptomyces sp. CA-251387]|uniref:helix-turn-helix transcriptional regulator n=1 Tax=Streptomyces sp. CA-251387 TaxID=3240064 RepID=UPI003D8CD2EE
MNSVHGLWDRQVEQNVLVTAVQGALARRSGFIAIESQAGMGKTALLRYAGDEARREGLRVLTARGVDLEREFSFGVARQLFEPALAAVPPEQRKRLLSGAAGAAAALVGQEYGPDAPLHGEFAILHGLYWLTANLCQKEPLVLLIDDVHWADTASLRFLAHLQPRLEELAVLVVISLRPDEPEAPAELLGRITTDHTCALLHPRALSEQAASEIVHRALGPEAEEEFVGACCRASGGSPLLLHEEVRAISEEGIAPTAANARIVEEVGARALSSRVALHLGRLPAEHLAMAGAAALLGEDSELMQAAAVAGIETHEAFAAAAQLAKLGLLEIADAVPNPKVRFSHPLIRAAIYQNIDPVLRNDKHRHIASLLVEQKVDPERAAAHLLRTSPVGEQWVIAALHAASRTALARGSPESASAYLRRCMAEPLEARDRVDTIIRLGTLAIRFEPQATGEYLHMALAETNDPISRAEIVSRLALMLAWQEHNDEALALCSNAIEELAPTHTELHNLLTAALLDMAQDDPAAYNLVKKRMAALLAAPSEETVGGRILDGLLSLHEAFTGADRKAVARRAHRGLGCGDMAISGEFDPLGAPRIAAYACSSFALMATDLEDVLPILDHLLAQAQQFHSEGDTVAAYTYRSVMWLWRGDLTEALADAHHALRLEEETGDMVNVPLALSVAVTALMEQGKLTEAADLLQNIDILQPRRIGNWFRVHECYGRLLLRQHHPDQALEAMLFAGDSFAATGGRNPAFTAWRSGAAECLHALGRNSEALRYAEEEIALARAWGAPRPLGHALRIAGQVAGGAQGVALLTEAVEVLEHSTARLELAHALVDLGAAIRRSGHRAEARPPLSRGLDLAHQCAAADLVEVALSELGAAGARPRRLTLTGPQALTPSERRVADLAATGLSNRDIAQQLYVTVKTVEVHLAKAYRKLGITSRQRLAAALQETPTHKSRSGEPLSPATPG